MNHGLHCNAYSAGSLVMDEQRTPASLHPTGHRRARDEQGGDHIEKNLRLADAEAVRVEQFFGLIERKDNRRISRRDPNGCTDFSRPTSHADDHGLSSSPRMKSVGQRIVGASSRTSGISVMRSRKLSALMTYHHPGTSISSRPRPAATSGPRGVPPIKIRVRRNISRLPEYQ